MGRIFFTSDTHFNHANVMKYCARPFASVEELVLAEQSPKEFKCRYCGAVLKRLSRHPGHRDGKCMEGDLGLNKPTKGVGGL